MALATSVIFLGGKLNPTYNKKYSSWQLVGTNNCGGSSGGYCSTTGRSQGFKIKLPVKPNQEDNQ